MIQQPTGSPRKYHVGWRGIGVSLLVVLGLISFTAYTAIHWTERQILTTDNWVAMVAPLPKNDTVASALSNYAVDQVFTATDLDARVQAALPERAAFLAPVLVTQLQERLDRRTKQFVKSDQFSSIWETANRRASERILTSAREDSAPATKAPAKVQVNLSALRERIREQLNPNGASEPPAITPTKNIGVAVDLKTSLERVKTYIRTIDFLNGTIGFLSLVCFVGAIVISRHRRRVIMIISASLAVVATLQLIGVKGLQPYVINQVRERAYRPAVEVVYNTLLTSFNRSATVILVLSLLVLVVAFVSRRALLERSTRLKAWINSADQSVLRQKWTMFRQLVRTYLIWIVVAAIFGWLLLMSFVLRFDTQGLVRTILSIFLTVELICLMAARSKRKPMKR